MNASPFEQQANPSLRKPAKSPPAEPKPRSKAKKGGEQVRVPASELLKGHCVGGCCQHTLRCMQEACPVALLG